MNTTHYGFRNGSTLCGAWRGFNAHWTPGVSGTPQVNCPACIAKYAHGRSDKR